MDEISILRKSNEILQQQNSDLAENLQHWKSEYCRLEVEKINLLRENIKYKQQISKFKRIENCVRQNLSRSLTDIAKSTNHIRQIIETLDEEEIDIWAKKSSPLPVRTPLQSNASNVNHVHPMIQGVTIKKPVIRISRASLNTIVRTTAQALVEDNSTNVIEALVEDNSSNVTDPITDDEEAPPPQQVTDSQRQLLDLCVSLSRVDATQNVTSRSVSNLETCTNQSASQQGTAADDIESQGSESSSQNSGYSEEYEGSANIISGEPFDYKSRLDCILEESETSSVNWVNSRKKLNPFVVLNNTIESDPTTSPVILRTPKQLNRSVNDDPMEGTSWHFDAQNVNIRPKSETKKRSIPADVIENVSDSQVPDSTTCGTTSREFNHEQDQSFVKSFPSVMEFQSTPLAANNEPDQKENETPPVTMSPARQQVEVKVIVSKMCTDALHGNLSIKSRRKLKRSGKSNSGSEVTLKKRNRITVSGSHGPEESSLLFQSSGDNIQVESFSCRPRRGEVKNYKEKPLNNKLRRSK